MDGLVSLTPDDPRAKEAIINLLGTTLAELKQIDKTVVGGSRNIAAVKTDLKNVLNFQQAPPTATVVNAGINVERHVPVATLQPQLAPQIQPVQQSEPPRLPEDPNQLVFDFNQKITPDVVNNKLDRILDKLDSIINILKN